MSTKKSFRVLCIIDLLLIGIYALYISLPEDHYLGYYPIGIVQIILLTGALISLFLYLRTRIIKKEISLASILLFAGYILSILFMVFGVFVWAAFLPGR